MKRLFDAAAFLCALSLSGPLAAQTPKAPEAPKGQPVAAATIDNGLLFTAESSGSDGEVTVEGSKVAYHAVAGTLVVHPKGWDDAAQKEASQGDGKSLADDGNPKAEASIFYVAYFKKGVPSSERPVTFFYNGGPGSSTVWLHMGAFGPKRVITRNDSHTPPAPYELADNAYSLLDASDLVFIDAPGTGFSRIAGKDKEKAFFGVDEDAYAFGEFISGFLGKYGRWNSPKFLFGESYGTPRSAVLVNALEQTRDIDVNGVMLLSQILNFDLSADGPQFNPGTDGAYVVALPTYAATAWYHNRLGPNRPADLEAYLHEVEGFALGEYASALAAGSTLDPQRRQAVAEKLAQYTGLPLAYVLKSDLRVNGGQFEKTLLSDQDLTTGRLDTRFAGPTLDPLSKEAEYDPQSAAISSAYVAAFNDYVRRTLGFGAGRVFKPEIDVGRSWNLQHQPPGAPMALPGILNVMPDLAAAMKYDPLLKIMVAGGYYDLATPYFEGWYEMHHLPVPEALMKNIEFHYYPSGHMVYANEASLKALHDNAAAFIRRNAQGR